MWLLTVDSENDFEGAEGQASPPPTPEEDSSGAALDTGMGRSDNSGAVGFDGGVAVDDGAGSGMLLSAMFFLFYQFF